MSSISTWIRYQSTLPTTYDPLYNFRAVSLLAANRKGVEGSLSVTDRAPEHLNYLMKSKHTLAEINHKIHGKGLRHVKGVF